VIFYSAPVFIYNVSERVYRIPNDDAVSPEDIHPGADLSGADLSEAILNQANLTGANLKGADLSEAGLVYANLSEATLADANLTGADLYLTIVTDEQLESAQFDYQIPYDEEVSPADIRPDTDLSGADLSEADLPKANLRYANLTGADLSRADLPEAVLWKADLSGTDLYDADLSGVILTGADLTEAELRDANLSDATLAEVVLTGVTLSGRTEIDPPRDKIENWSQSSEHPPKQRIEDQIARANTELHDTYTANGLLSKSRKARLRVRKARRKEIHAEEGYWSLNWLLSRLSSIFTGYGISLKPIAVWMLILYFISAGFYHRGGMALDRSLYYSAVTFTTAPPNPPPTYLTSVVAGIETFAGTAAIIFLGYVLGSRERV
jgi:uncharacterized protein YjbI with pentapeptide repeats